MGYRDLSFVEKITVVGVAIAAVGLLWGVFIWFFPHPNDDVAVVVDRAPRIDPVDLQTLSEKPVVTKVSPDPSKQPTPHLICTMAIYMDRATLTSNAGKKNKDLRAKIQNLERRLKDQAEHELSLSLQNDTAAAIHCIYKYWEDSESCKLRIERLLLQKVYKCPDVPRGL